MKKNILSLAALLIASATFVACSSDDNITGEQPANPTGKYTMTINASKGGDATTRALTLGRNDADTKNVLNATWDANEVVLVYQGGSQIGTLYSAASTTNETTLTGELDSAPDADQDLTLYFHTNATPSYTGQDGTLATIASTYDFCAPATITAGSFTVSGSTVSTTSSASFGANQQAIVKFTLIDKADGLTPLSATQLVVNDGTTDYTINPTPATSEIYAAIPGFTGKTVTLTATVGGDTYTYEKTGVSFTNGQYYEITVKMKKAPSSVLVTAITLNKTATTIYKVNGTATETLSVTAVAPDEATDKTYTWSSDNEAAATVDASGVVTAVADGTAHIRATANDGSGVYGECTVTVSDLSAYYSKMVECGCDDLDGKCADGGNPKSPFTGQVLSAAQAIALAQAKAADTGSNCAVFYDNGSRLGEIRFAKNDGTTGSAQSYYTAADKGLSGYRGFYVSK